MNSDIRKLSAIAMSLYLDVMDEMTMPIPREIVMIYKTVSGKSKSCIPGTDTSPTIR